MVALQISRQWGKEPDWFYQQSRESQIRLLALYRHENTPKKELQKKQKQTKQARLKAAIEQYAKRDQHG